MTRSALLLALAWAVVASSAGAQEFRLAPAVAAEP
jgi:hypothetical protein